MLSNEWNCINKYVLKYFSGVFKTETQSIKIVRKEWELTEQGLQRVASSHILATDNFYLDIICFDEYCFLKDSETNVTVRLVQFSTYCPMPSLIQYLTTWPDLSSNWVFDSPPSLKFSKLEGTLEIIEFNRFADVSGPTKGCELFHW